MAALAIGTAVLLILGPTEFYLGNRRVEEWMIYRFVVSFIFGAAGALALGAASLVNRMSELVLDREASSFLMRQLVRMFRGVRLWIVASGLVAVGFFLVWPGIVEYFTTGEVFVHWSRVIVAAFAFLIAFQAVLTGILLRITSLWLEFAVGRDGHRRGVEG
jgi:hypothetical protein